VLNNWKLTYAHVLKKGGIKIKIYGSRNEERKRSGKREEIFDQKGR